MAWANVPGSNSIWQFDDAATTANTYPAAMHLSRANGSDSGGIRTFTTPGASPNETTYIKCRKVDSNTIMRGELSKNYYDGQV